MIKVLVVYERMMATVAGMKEEYGCMFDGDKEIRFTIEEAEAVTKEQIDEADIITLVRPENSLAFRIASCAKKAGKGVVVFCDDDLLAIPVGINGTPLRKKVLKKTLRLSHQVHILRRSILIRQKPGSITSQKHQLLRNY